MTAKELKASILDLAVRGKLVPQDPNDEPASVLLEKIRAEKQKLVKAGKIKKEKNPSEIYIASDGRPYEKFADGSETCIEDEVPFDLPPGWAWARLGDLCSKVVDCPHTTPVKSSIPTEYPCIRTSEIKGGNIRWDTMQYVSFNEYEKRTARLVPEANDLVYAREGAFGDAALLPPHPKFCLGQRTMLFRFLKDLILPRYLLFAVTSPHVYGQAQALNVAGTTNVPHVNVSDAIRFTIPLPPLNEQHRIVSKIDALLGKVDEYACTNNLLLDLNTSFPSQIKRSILQSAVEGKLVPQDPNDEPAYILVERIAEERKALVMTGKLKREKHESVIFRGSDRLTYETRDGETVCIEDELPFKIPENWAWVRLGAIATIIRGSGIKRDEIVPVGVPCIRYGELYTTYRTQISAIVSHTTEAVARRAKPIKRGDVILTLTGENKEDIGTAAAYLVENDAEVGGDVAVLKDHHCDPLWLSYFLAAPFAVRQKAGMSNGDIIVHLAAQSVASILVPLPPLAEQKRIVVQIEKMLKVSAALTT